MTRPFNAMYRCTAQPALFLDRDGVINQLVVVPPSREISGLDSPITVAEFRLIDGVRDALTRWRRLGVLIFVVSNQPGYAKNKMSLRAIHDITARMLQVVTKNDNPVPITEVYYCTHHPQAVQDHLRECTCRKPQPGLFLQAAAEWNIDLEASVAVGDQDRDTLAAHKAGVGTIFQLGAAYNPTSLAGCVSRIDRRLGL